MTSKRSIVFIRLMVGLIFLSEGIQKYLFSDTLGSGRFRSIGIPYPDIMGPFVGGVEIVCGSLLIIGFLTRLAAIPLLCVILTAIVTTKIPQLLTKGFWQMAHDARADFSMLMGLLFLIFSSSGNFLIDVKRRFFKRS